jgi:hypothetical protein
MLVGDLIILTEETGKITPRKKDIARSTAAADRRLFIKKGLEKSHGCLITGSA